MKLLKKAPAAIIPTLKETYKFNDKLEVTNEYFDGRGGYDKITNLFIVSKVNNKTLHVVDNKGDTYVMNPNETGTTVRIVED